MLERFFGALWQRSDPGVRHAAIAASTTPLSPRPRSIYCHAAGTLTVRDEMGVDLPYTLTAGQVLPFSGVAVPTITSGTFYAWG